MCYEKPPDIDINGALTLWRVLSDYFRGSRPMHRCRLYPQTGRQKMGMKKKIETNM
jgi:hypothetical protein